MNILSGGSYHIDNEVSLRVLTPASTEPITLEDARNHCHIDSYGSPPAHEDDDLLSGLIASAREHVEAFTGRTLSDAQYELRQNYFCGDIQLPIAPVQSIISVTYIDADGATQTLDSATYVFDDDPKYPNLTLAHGKSWPVVRGDRHGVRVQFQGGYTDGNSPNVNPMPKSLKSAMLLIIRELYDNRSQLGVGQSYEICVNAQALMTPFRIGMGV